jgi:hypothetical protein
MRHREDEEFEEIASYSAKTGHWLSVAAGCGHVLFKQQQLGMINGYEKVPYGEMSNDLGAFDADSRIIVAAGASRG